MVRRFLQIRDHMLKVASASDSPHRDLVLLLLVEREQLECLEGLVRLWIPFEQVTGQCGRTSSPTMPHVPVWVTLLRQHLRDFVSTADRACPDAGQAPPLQAGLRNLAAVMLDSSARYLIERYILPSPQLCVDEHGNQFSRATAPNAIVAAALHPDYQHLQFLDGEEQDLLLPLLVQRMQTELRQLQPDKQSEDDEGVHAKPGLQKRVRMLGMEQRANSCSEADCINTWLTRYTEEPAAGRFTLSSRDVLAFWREHRTYGDEGRHLGVLAQAFLGMPAASTESERTFSSAGFLASKLRSRLTPQRAARTRASGGHPLCGRGQPEPGPQRTAPVAGPCAGCACRRCRTRRPTGSRWSW
jgi:hypothetical protein